MTTAEGQPKSYIVRGVLNPYSDDVDAIRTTHTLLEGNLYSPDPLIRPEDRIIIGNLEDSEYFTFFDDQEPLTITDGQVLVEFGPNAASDLQILGIDDVERPLSIEGFSYAVFDGYEGYQSYSERIGKHAIEALRDEIASTPFGSTSDKLTSAERRISLSVGLTDEERFLNSVAGIIHQNPKKGSELVHVFGMHILLESVQSNQTRPEQLAQMDKLLADTISYYKNIKAEAGENMDENPEFLNFTSNIRTEIEQIKKELQEAESE